MFDKIAPKYDFLNRLLSMRQDVYWRKEMVKAAKLEFGADVLDAACGTCDVGLEVSRVLKGRTSITGLDFSFGMLVLGKRKLNCPKGRAICLVNGDALNLPLKNQQFDAGFMAFGIRNIMNRTGAMKEFYRTLKPGGRIIILELTTPQKGLMRRLYLLYFQKILPLIGSFFSKHGNAYAYLPESVIKFPDPVSFASQMKAAGFKEIRFKEMTLGIVTLFVGIKL
ncbi:MAG: bifunctional demethylmenaquinone methyltransferase/2-methoxy-6-polyprenyl-1,4-benzoquinol methylase UbiE [Desulfobacter sp.]|nr:bifunctional demethylmenaquinone methyltransferase/2-methoxy-6-polyprenyl-1,4-benzoquinol methylase UbiE [Desulfobacter sp.]